MMRRAFTFFSAIVALAAAPAAVAQTPTEMRDFTVVELREFNGGAAFAAAQERLYQNLLGATSGNSADGAFPMRVSFDGEFEFLKTSRRLRIWRPEVGYRLMVGANGEVTDCKITQEFRRAYVNQKLCEVLSKHHHFEPADALVADSGSEREYASTLVYMEMREKLEAER